MMKKIYIKPEAKTYNVNATCQINVVSLNNNGTTINDDELDVKDASDNTISIWDLY